MKCIKNLRIIDGKFHCYTLKISTGIYLQDNFHVFSKMLNIANKIEI